jgi:hypothetical protein
VTPTIPRSALLIIRYGLYFFFAWVAVYWRRRQKRRREAAAAGWPSVEALILYGQVLPVPKTSCFLATLKYSYFVGEYRSGEYVQEFARELDADDFIRQLKDKRLPIRYNPDRPEKSVLEQSVVEQHVPAALLR